MENKVKAAYKKPDINFYNVNMAPPNAGTASSVMGSGTASLGNFTDGGVIE